LVDADGSKEVGLHNCEGEYHDHIPGKSSDKVIEAKEEENYSKGEGKTYPINVLVRFHKTL
jgi:hypothetical protein